MGPAVERKLLDRALRDAKWIVRTRYWNSDEAYSVAVFSIGVAWAYWHKLSPFRQYAKRCVRLALWHWRHREILRMRAEKMYCTGHREAYDSEMLAKWFPNVDMLPRDELKLAVHLRYGTTQSWAQLSELTSWPVWYLRALVKEALVFLRKVHDKEASEAEA